MTNRVFFFSLIFIFIGNICTAQLGMGKVDDIEKFKIRKLIVMIETEDIKYENMLKSKNKTEELENYKNTFDNFNNGVKEIFTKRWDLNSSIEFKTFDEIKKIENKSDYAVILFKTGVTNSFTIGAQKAIKYNPGIQWDTERKNEDRNYEKSFCIIEFKLLENTNPILPLSLANIYPQKSDFLYAISSAKSYFKQRLEKTSKDDIKKEINENNSLLKDKTLLIKKSLLYKKLDVNLISTYYPYKYEIVDDKDFENKASSSDEKYAFLLINPIVLNPSSSTEKEVNSKGKLTDKNNGTKTNEFKLIYSHGIIDAKTGKVLGLIEPSLASLMLLSTAGEKFVTKNTLKEYIKKK